MTAAQLVRPGDGFALTLLRSEGRTYTMALGTPKTLTATTAPAATPTRAVRRVGIRIGFVLAFAVACALIFFFQTAPAMLHDRAHSQIPGAPGWLLTLECAFVLLPFFLTGFVLVFQARRPTLMATGSGIAAGLFGLFLLVSPFALLSMLCSWASPPTNCLEGRIQELHAPSWRCWH